ncbi:hypothetical protein LGT41_0005315 [Abyssibius alkaniclasticus]|uniref:hypothetical protein n=1 Tax=Abyssibius alkaniclasticus TaxID=2881234 RepID=UPI002363B9C5|nr:hypothetical protein [Abyssibius alkaniclasticus]UPH72236.1 hypothetical protein LGT41_0005315 [Abyssibius alkaniclasticus]
MTIKIDDAYLDAFEDDIVRLSRRTYAEAGVPMYLVPEDLTGAAPAATPDPDGEAMAALFTAVTQALEARNGPLSTSDIAHVLEVLADRHFLSHPFSELAR